jgi:hypothetical protein
MIFGCTVWLIVIMMQSHDGIGKKSKRSSQQAAGYLIRRQSRHTCAGGCPEDDYPGSLANDKSQRVAIKPLKCIAGGI